MTRLPPRLSFARLCGIALTAVALAHLPASAGERTQKPAKKQQSTQVNIKNIRSSSEETLAQRDRRLYRECQGRPNAGACAGYTYRPPKNKR